jgi:hypothetical protein
LIVDGLENLQTKTHIRGMEKTIALTAVVAILIFVAVYALSAWRSHGGGK